MKSQRRAPASARPSAPTAAGPHANARAVYQHVENYLIGALNDDALDAWRVAVGTGLAAGFALDAILHRMCKLALEAR